MLAQPMKSLLFSRPTSKFGASNLSLGLVSVLLSTGLLACQEQPDRACERVRFGWPHFELNTSQDESPTEGVQISFSVRSDLLPGGVGNLSIETGEDGEEVRTFVAKARADQAGLLTFEDITIPVGRFIFLLDAEDACGVARSGKRVYLWDGLGQPQCALSIASGFDIDPDTGASMLGPAQDEDLDTPGMQVTAEVNAGRPDMRIRLFVRDRTRGSNQDFQFDSSTGEQPLTLGEGEQALRAVCFWEKEDFHMSTPTRVYHVESE
jgi:hypothetical protein